MSINPTDFYSSSFSRLNEVAAQKDSNLKKERTKSAFRSKSAQLENQSLVLSVHRLQDILAEKELHSREEKHIVALDSKKKKEKERSSPYRSSKREGSMDIQECDHSRQENSKFDPDLGKYIDLEG